MAAFSFNFALDGEAQEAPAPVVKQQEAVQLMRRGERFVWAPSRALEAQFSPVELPPMRFETVNTTDAGFLARTGDISAILTKSDVQTGVYEGGFKLWECALDLVRFMDASGAPMPPKVLELGCGHGLPGIYALQKGAQEVVFMDYNKEVLELTTCPNVLRNVSGDATLYARASFYAGAWSSVSEYMQNEEKKSAEDMQYDLILTAETIYTDAVTVELYQMIKRHLRRAPGSRALVAAKKYYFGTGGSVQQFLEIVRTDGVFHAEVVWQEADFRSNIREIVQLTCI